MTGHDDVPTVLLADDETPLLEMYELFLGEAHDVITAADGDEVLEHVDESIDVVILDRRMPRVAGDEALATLRERGYEMPVAMVSAVAPDSDIIEMSLDAYLTKPLDSEELQTLVELLVARQDIDEHSRNFLRLASKKAALEASGRVNSDDSDIKDLYRQIETARTEMAGDLSGIVPSGSAEIPGSVDISSAIE